MVRDRPYPALYYASDGGSSAAQRNHLRLIGSQLTIFVLVSASGALELSLQRHFHFNSTVITAILLTLGLFIMFITRAQHNERDWFDCRAVAESTKTSAWRYMMQTHPYGADLGDKANVLFVEQLREISTSRPGIAARFTVAPGPQITEFMRQMRARPLDERQNAYLRDRVQEQLDWYARKMGANQRVAVLWFWIIVAVQAIALVLAIIRVTAFITFSSISLLMTVAATLTAWTQVKRYDELTESYSLATQELSALHALGDTIHGEANFQSFVLEVEGAISREHTMWLARRNVQMIAGR